MKIVVCIEDNDGVMFNKRRVSSDAKVIDKIISTLGENRLFLNEYSSKLFMDKTDKLSVSDEFLNMAADNDFCFIEDSDVSCYLHKANQIIIYRWNRKYPSDFKFPTDEATEGRKLLSRTDFVGNSHEKITEEIWQ